VLWTGDAFMASQYLGEKYFLAHKKKKKRRKYQKNKGMTERASAASEHP